MSEPIDTRTIRCATCGANVPMRANHPEPQAFPFCSARCKLMDLGKWLDGSYVLSRPLAPDEVDEAFAARDELDPTDPSDLH